MTGALNECFMNLVENEDQFSRFFTSCNIGEGAKCLSHYFNFCQDPTSGVLKFQPDSNLLPSAILDLTGSGF